MLRGCFQSPAPSRLPFAPARKPAGTGELQPVVCGESALPALGHRCAVIRLKTVLGKKKSQGPKGEGALGGWLGRPFGGCRSFCLCPSPCSTGPVPTESSHFIPGARDGQTDSPGAGGQCWERRWGAPAWEMPVARAGIAEVEARGVSWGNWILSPSFGPRSWWAVVPAARGEQGQRCRRARTAGRPKQPLMRNLLQRALKETKPRIKFPGVFGTAHSNWRGVGGLRRSKLMGRGVQPGGPQT